MMVTESMTRPAEAEVLSALSNLLIREAWLRDNDQLDDWFDMYAPQLRYWAPVRQFMGRGEEDIHQTGLFTHIDEDRSGLELRIRRLQSGLTFTDEPPPRIRHFISNIQLLDHDDGAATTISYFMAFRSHPGHRDTTAVGYRKDRWTKIAGEWKICERMIVLDQDRLTSYLTLL